MPETASSATATSPAVPPATTPIASSVPPVALSPGTDGAIARPAGQAASARLVYRTLDTWRGVAALAVVFLHAFALQAEQSPAFASSALFAPFQYGYLGVELFFVISGYCIAAAALSNIARGDSVGRFAYARLRRIFPPYWASTLFFVLGALGMTVLMRRGGVSASHITGVIDASRHGPLYYAANAALLQIPLRQDLMNPVAWTLGYELAFYTIFAIAIAALARRGADRMLLALHGLTAGVLLWQVVAPQTCPFPLDMWPQFGAGVLLFDWLRRPRSRAVRASLAVVLPLFVLFLALRDVPVGTLGHSSRLAGGVALCFALLLAFLHPSDERLAGNPAVRLLGVVGVFSYSLYLISFLSLGLLRQITTHFSVFNGHPALGMFTSALLTVGLGYVFHVLFERPFLNTRRPPLGASGKTSS